MTNVEELPWNERWLFPRTSCGFHPEGAAQIRRKLLLRWTRKKCHSSWVLVWNDMTSAIYRHLVRSTLLPGCALCVAVWSHPSEAAVTVTPVVHRAYAHDPEAFTQGLLFYGGQLYESTGLYGSSTLRRVELTTGAVKQSVALAATEFGEGLAQVEDRLIQLTWKSGLAHVFDLTSFEHRQSFDYSGEGWGLCFDGQRLVMSDGSSSLFFRNPTTFEMTGSVTVTRDGVSLRQLNELECVNGWVYANVWQTKHIVKIDPGSGNVVATLLVDGLLTSEEAANADVLNGIAYLPETSRFYITGKLWPKLFEVDFPDAAGPVPAPGETRDSGSSETSVSQTKPTGNGDLTSGGANTPSGHGAPSSGESSSPSPPKVQSGCHCAAVGAGAGVPPAVPWTLACVATILPLLGFERRARRRSLAGRKGAARKA